MYADAILLALLEKSGAPFDAVQKARDYLEIGVQRLLSFESRDGGFGWYSGKAPVPMLTARALETFTQIGRVHPLDPAILERIRGSLLADASWQDSGSPGAAYILMALAEAGERAENLERPLRILKDRCRSNAYLTAMVANALALLRPEDPDLGPMLDGLAKGSVPEGPDATLFGGSDVEVGTETLALTILAAAREGKRGEFVRRALPKLFEKKTSGGTWGATSTTLLSLRAMEAAWAPSVAGPATIRIVVDRKERKIVLAEKERDVAAVVDLTDFVGRDASDIEVLAHRADGMVCQIVRRYALPWSMIPKPPSPLALNVEYERKKVTQEESIQAKVRMRYEGKTKTFMVVASLPIPPGFSAPEDPFRELAGRGSIDRYEMRNDRVTLYFGEVLPAQEVAFSYTLVACQPMLALARGAEAYEYYAPAVRAESVPTVLEITPRPKEPPVIRTRK